MVRLAVVTSHPIQYQTPLFRELARRLDLHVYFAHRATPQDQAAAGFGVAFDWDVDLLSGYEHTFLRNVARQPGIHGFYNCDTPSVGAVLRNTRPDALLVMGWHFKSYWQAIGSARLAGVPVLVRGDSHLKTHRSLVKKVTKAAIYPAALRVFNAALYVGEYSKQYWEHYGFPERRMYFSPHCVDNNWFAHRATAGARAKLRQIHGTSNTKVILFAGKLIPEKRPLDVVAAASNLHRTGAPITVVVVGAGLLKQELVAAAHAQSVPLVCMGFCNQSEMPALYAAADILVLSSSLETWGLVANEALACGTPIVVSDRCGCAPDLAADGIAGRVFRVGDIDDLTNAVRALCLNPPAKDAIAGKIDRYSPSVAADGILEAVKIHRNKDCT